MGCRDSFAPGHYAQLRCGESPLMLSFQGLVLSRFAWPAVPKLSQRFAKKVKEVNVPG
jgi:hypothetical protein